jgi:hypothetical protein
MTNTKWLRQALLGSVALGVMATGAQADELSELKAQLEGLQSRVNQIEQQPNYAALPEGASFITLNRGTADFKMDSDRATLRNETPQDRGFTISVTPTADLPAPIAEVVVYGFVKGDVIYSIENDTGDSFSIGALFSGGSGNDNHIRMHARQSRFGIRSRTDTAIGQIRSMIEVDFFGTLRGNTPDPRLRHAYGEWDMTPNWTLLIGRTTRTGTLTPIGIPTVDFGYSAGLGLFPRAAQVRLTYHSGPISWAIAAEDPSLDGSRTGMPDLASYIQFDAPGGHQFIVTGAVGDRSSRDVFLFTDPVTQEDAFFRTDSDLGWAIQAGANINLADIATLTVGGGYGDGMICTYINQGAFCNAELDTFHNPDLDFIGFVGGTAWAAQAGLSFGLTDTTTFNVQYGFVRSDNDLGRGDFGGGYNPADSLDAHTVHANILWQPVQQMRLGWEVMWGKYTTRGGDSEIDLGEDGIFDRGKQSEDAIRAQFGAWFFF